MMKLLKKSLSKKNPDKVPEVTEGWIEPKYKIVHTDPTTWKLFKEVNGKWIQLGNWKLDIDYFYSEESAKEEMRRDRRSLYNRFLDKLKEDNHVVTEKIYEGPHF